MRRSAITTAGCALLVIFLAAVTNADDKPTPARHERHVIMEVTGYCPCKKCCGPKARGVTASGRDITDNGGRFVAADTKKLPFGTKVVIPGYADDKPVEVLDRGGAIKGDKLDLFFPTHKQALQWGRRRVEVTILE